MASMEKKSLDSPDETRPLPKGKMEVVNLGGVTVGRATFEPGWRWSESVKPIVGTNSCQVAHTWYMIAGRMRVKMDDGTKLEFGPHDALVIPPGHDAWIVGNEPAIVLDFSGSAQYAKPQ